MRFLHRALQALSKRNIPVWEALVAAALLSVEIAAVTYGFYLGVISVVHVISFCVIMLLWAAKDRYWPEDYRGRNGWKLLDDRWVLMWIAVTLGLVAIVINLELATELMELAGHEIIIATMLTSFGVGWLVTTVALVSLRNQHIGIGVISEQIEGKPFELLEKLRPSHKNSILAQMIGNLLEARNNNPEAEVDYQAELDDTSDLLEDQKSNVGFISGSLVFLGIVGTAAGLIVALDGMQNHVLVQNGGSNMISKIMDGLGVAMGGMTAAFFATILGILLGAIVLGLGVHLIGLSQGVLLVAMSRMLRVSVMPYMQPKSAEQALTDGAMDMVREQLLAMTAEITQNAGTGIAGVLKDASKQIAEQGGTELTRWMNGELGDEIRETVREATAGNGNSGVEAIEALLDSEKFAALIAANQQGDPALAEAIHQNTLTMQLLVKTMEKQTAQSDFMQLATAALSRLMGDGVDFAGTVKPKNGKNGSDGSTPEVTNA